MPDATFESVVEAAADAADVAAGRNIEGELEGDGEPEAVFAESEFGRQCELLRDVFGNPFRRVTTEAAWLTPAVTALAQEVYETRDFSLMPAWPTRSRMPGATATTSSATAAVPDRTFVVVG